MRARRAEGSAGGHSRAALAHVEIVRMRRRHLGGVLRIEERVYPRPWSRRLFESELDRPDNRSYVVALAPRRLWPVRKVVGYAGVMVQVGEAHITTVAVHPGEHRRKVATRLLIAVLEAALRLGADSATLEVRAANHGAQRLYSSFGFAPVGVRPGYYAETGEDALIMWAHDLQGEAFARRLRAEAERVDLPGGASGAPDHPVPWTKDRVGLAPDPAAAPDPRRRPDDGGGRGLRPGG